MMTFRRRLRIVFSFALAASLGLCPAVVCARDAVTPVPVNAIHARGLDEDVLRLALAAVERASGSLDAAKPHLLTIIDYSLPSTEKRLWLLDLRSGKTIYHELVAHGQGSGDNWAFEFSNVMGSKQTSLGLFLTEETYTGQNGYSLRLRGLEPGVNDLARPRTIVMHGAPYVSERHIRKYGRLGRSWGCPAVRREVAAGLIDLIKDGSFVFGYYPDPSWLSRSPFLDLKDVPSADAVSSAGH